MDTKIVYCDETGDDGLNTSSSSEFILTSISIPISSWQDTYNTVKQLRTELSKKYGFHVKEEMHTKHFLTDKDPYRKYNWSNLQKIEILNRFIQTISNLQMSVINVNIDKAIIRSSTYNVLENALKYNIQRIENDCNSKWKYIIITDKGRLAPMRRTARLIRSYNPIPSQFSLDTRNIPIGNLIEDILEKDSKESYFIQICDFISYFVHLYYRTEYYKESLPTRVGRLIDINFVNNVIECFYKGNILNTKASKNNYGLVIYPKN